MERTTLIRGLVTLLVATFMAPGAAACGGIRTEARLPADGATEVPLNTRVYLGGFGPGAFGPGRSGAAPTDDWQPVLRGPAGVVAVAVEVQADGRAWWALARPIEPLLPHTVYTVVASGVESQFTTGSSLESTPPPPPMGVTVTPRGKDPCAAADTCGLDASLRVVPSSAPADPGLYRVFVQVEGEASNTLVGVVPADATDWGVGLGDAANNVRAFAPGDVSGLSPVQVWDEVIGKTLCVSVTVEDLAGNAPSPADGATACGVLPDPRPTACAAGGEVRPGDAPDAGPVGDTAPDATSSSSGCQSGARPAAWWGGWAALLVVGVLHRRAPTDPPGPTQSPPA